MVKQLWRDCDGARWGMGESTLNDFIFGRLLGQGNEEEKSMWGGGCWIHEIYS